MRRVPIAERRDVFPMRLAPHPRERRNELARRFLRICDRPGSGRELLHMVYVAGNQAKRTEGTQGRDPKVNQQKISWAILWFICALFAIVALTGLHS
jgi:hypothetical protein